MTSWNGDCAESVEPCNVAVCALTLQSLLLALMPWLFAQSVWR